jgi:hypothetical protein
MIALAQEGLFQRHFLPAPRMFYRPRRPRRPGVAALLLCATLEALKAGRAERDREEN